MIAAGRSQHELNAALAEIASDPEFEVAMHLVRQGSKHHVAKRTPRLALRIPVFDGRTPDLAIDGRLASRGGWLRRIFPK